MIMDGMKVMMIGMSVVFLMLMIIITSVYISAWFIRRFEKPSPPGAPASSLNPHSSENNAGVIAAISAAIFRHRRGK